jgi:5-methylcytosine-specific restriction endonuclease McrA
MSKESLKVISFKAKKKDDNVHRKAVNFQWFKEYNGGYRCHHCGYDACEKALEFHHLIPSQKKSLLDSFARWLYRRPDKFQAWVRGTVYVILCANCHRELHAGMWEINKQPNRHSYDRMPDDPAIALWGKGGYGQ